MSLELVANEDMAVAFNNSAGPPDLIYTSDPGIDAVKVVPIKSTTCKIANKYICTTSVTITWTLATSGCPYTSATYDFVSGSAVILASSLTTKADSQFVLRETDSSLLGCIGGWTLKVSPFTPIACACSAEIASAGQTTTRSE